MPATLATAAMLLVPFLAVVLVGAVAVAIHDAIERAWAGGRTSARARANAAAARRPVALREARWCGAPVVPARSGSARRTARRAPAVLVR
ncbi:MAG: hypothetical protein ABR510_03420 [Trueperaceae bacterium]